MLVTRPRRPPQFDALLRDATVPARRSAAPPAAPEKSWAELERELEDRRSAQLRQREALFGRVAESLGVSGSDAQADLEDDIIV